MHCSLNPPLSIMTVVNGSLWASSPFTMSDLVQIRWRRHCRCCAASTTIMFASTGRVWAGNFRLLHMVRARPLLTVHASTDQSASLLPGSVVSSFDRVPNGIGAILGPRPFQATVCPLSPSTVPPSQQREPNELMCRRRAACAPVVLSARQISVRRVACHVRSQAVNVVCH